MAETGVEEDPRLLTHFGSDGSGRADGFTLLELLVAILIVSILIGVYIFAFTRSSPDDDSIRHPIDVSEVNLLRR